jgi:hypothetical protein
MMEIAVVLAIVSALVACVMALLAAREYYNEDLELW